MATEPPHTPEELEEWRQQREAYEGGDLSPAQARRYMKEHRGTYFERGFKRLRYTDAVKVYEVANHQEKAMLGQLLREKRQNLIRQHREVPEDQQDSTR